MVRQAVRSCGQCEGNSRNARRNTLPLCERTAAQSLVFRQRHSKIQLTILQQYCPLIVIQPLPAVALRRPARQTAQLPFSREYAIVRARRCTGVDPRRYAFTLGPQFLPYSYLRSSDLLKHLAVWQLQESNKKSKGVQMGTKRA